MSRNKDKMIIEEVPLTQCVKGDEIDVCYNQGVKWSTVGYITLLKIKVLKNGILQIKYRKHWKDAIVQKAEVPATVMVKRMRKVTDADGPDAGFVPKEKVVINGITYEVDPEIANISDLQAVTPDPVDLILEKIAERIPSLCNSYLDKEIMSHAPDLTPRRARSPLLDLLSKRMKDLTIDSLKSDV